MNLNKTILLILFILLISYIGVSYKSISNNRLLEEIIALSPQSSSQECGCIIQFGYGEKLSFVTYTQSIIDAINSNPSDLIKIKADINLENCDSATCSKGKCAVYFAQEDKEFIKEGTCSIRYEDPNPEQKPY